LPGDARDVIYRRMREMLSGRDNGRPYARLSRGDRQAVVEILRETKTDLPAYFNDSVR